MKVLFIIAPQNFRDEEYFETKNEVEKIAEVITASLSLEEATGMLGGRIKPDITLDDVDVDEFDAVVFVGGTGAEVYFDNPKAKEIASEAFGKGKIIGAICIAPTILANAGVLKGKSATIWRDSDLIENLKLKGAKFVEEPVVRDGNVITAWGPDAARRFGKEISKALREK